MEPTENDEANTEVALIDLAHLRDLLGVLKDSGVHSFQAGGLTVVFNEPEIPTFITKPTTAATVADDGHSTSTKRVDGFKNPILYPWQNGKMLRFDGSLE